MDVWRAESPHPHRDESGTGRAPEPRLALRERDLEPGADGRLVMVYGEHRPEAAVEPLRWLGPGAELLEPREWRQIVAAGLREMLASYEG